MLTIRETGRVLSWFEKDLAIIRPWLRVDPVSLAPYRPPGVWCYPDRRLGPQALFKFTPPCHPLEAIAALRGWDGDLLTIAESRATTWLEGTAMLARYLFVSAETLRLVYQLLTPLNIPASGPRYHNAHKWVEALWDACGFPGDQWEEAHMTIAGPKRPNFWTQEVTGEIEL